MGPSAEARDRKAKFTTETQRTRRFEGKEIRTFNRSSQRSRRQIGFRLVLSVPLFVAFVIFCEKDCFGATRRKQEPKGRNLSKPLASILRVLFVSVVNILGLVGFIGAFFWGWGLGEKLVRRVGV